MTRRTPARPGERKDPRRDKTDPTIEIKSAGDRRAPGSAAGNQNGR
jgi:hypothetical protein